MPPVPFDRVSAFLRLLSHDVRNELGALDLEAAYIAQAADDPATAAEAKKLRKIVTEAAVKMKRLSASVGRITVKPQPFPARMFIEEMRVRLSKTWPSEMASAAWNLELGSEEIAIEFEMMASALHRIFDNAFQFREASGWIEFRAFVRDANIVMELIEGKSTVPSPPENWGEEPFVSTRKDGYGLGLFFARRVIGAHHGKLTARHDDGRHVLVTQIALPIEKK